MTDVWNKVEWGKEACDQLPDPKSGAAITRVSGSMIATNNNYFEGSCSADGKRCIGIRFMDPLLSPVKAILALDLETKWTALLDTSLKGWHVLGTPFSGLFYYINAQNELCRVSLETFDKEVLMDMRDLPPVDQTLRTVTPDQRYLFYITQVTIPEGLSLAIVKIDLQEKSWSMIYENSGLHHIVYLPAYGLYVGRRTLKNGSTPPLGEWKNREIVAAGHLMDIDGHFLRSLGPPPGYTTFLPDGQAVSNYAADMVNNVQKPERPNGNMFVFDSLDWKDGRQIEAPEHIFNHVSSSRDGRYAVAEAIPLHVGLWGPISIVVVNIDTGKHRTLVADCGSKCCGGGSAWRQPLPYLTSDNHHVVYSADPDGILNVYAAQIPDGFLESLE
jgi:hypothetical protein